MNNSPQIKTLMLVSALLLFAAIIPIWPYGLYVLLRFLICGVALYGVYAGRQNEPLERHKIPLIVLAVLFNPLVPIHFGRSSWAFIDLIVGIYLMVLSLKLPAKNSREEEVS